MFLTILTLSGFALGSSGFKYDHSRYEYGDYEVSKYDLKMCYGEPFHLSDYTPPRFRGRMYFTPSKNGGPWKLVMENGETKDPRFKVSVTSVTLPELTERDEGTFSITLGDGSDIIHDIIYLKVLECAEHVERSYKSMYSCDVPSKAAFLEFTPSFSLDTPRVLWNRTDPQTNTGGRGHVKHNVWEIFQLTQADNGFYNFRRKDNTLQFRIRLTVAEYTRYYDAKVKEQLHIRYPVAFTPWNMAFIPKRNKRSIMLMKDGNLVAEDSLLSDVLNFTGRLQEVDKGIVIDPVESTDSGVFEFRDQEGNLALVVWVNIDNDPIHIYIPTIVGIIAAVIIGCCCCCCLKMHCCNNSCAKKQSAPQTAAAPAVYYHDTNQTEGPSYSAAQPASAYSYQSLNPLGTRGPTTSLGSPAYNPVDIHVNPTQPEVAVPGGQGAAPALSIGTDCLSDSGPKFELKGVTFPSAPPLSSDSTCDVYTSDKLNFL